MRIAAWCVVLLVAVIFAAVYYSGQLRSVPQRAGLLPRDYFEARNDFLKAATESGAALSAHAIQARGARGEVLTIDTAWFGSSNPERMLLHISGTHGVEGFPGSAIQREIMRRKFSVPDDSAVVFIHGLNPWGMAHIRRFNESNVDLNRNFMLDTAAFHGAPDSYRAIESFLNPHGAPSRYDLFLLRTVFLVGLHGFTTLKQAIAGGQYEYEHGIYFGGHKLEESSQFLRAFVQEKLSKVRKLSVIEVHSGLGEWGKDVLFWPLPDSHPRTQALEAALAEDLASDAPEEGVGFRTPGDLQNEVPKLLPDTEVEWVLQEFGAYGPVRTLMALRDENRFHRYGSGEAGHWSKRALLEAFSPGDAGWQNAVIQRGVQLFEKFSHRLATARE